MKSIGQKNTSILRIPLFFCPSNGTHGCFLVFCLGPDDPYRCLETLVPLSNFYILLTLLTYTNRNPRKTKSGVYTTFCDDVYGINKILYFNKFNRLLTSGTVVRRI